MIKLNKIKNGLLIASSVAILNSCDGSGSSDNTQDPMTDSVSIPELSPTDVGVGGVFTSTDSTYSYRLEIISLRRNDSVINGTGFFTIIKEGNEIMNISDADFEYSLGELDIENTVAPTYSSATKSQIRSASVLNPVSDESGIAGSQYANWQSTSDKADAEDYADQLNILSDSYFLRSDTSGSLASPVTFHFSNSEVVTNGIFMSMDADITDLSDRARSLEFPSVFRASLIDTSSSTTQYTPSN